MTTEDDARNESQRRLLQSEASLHAFTLELGDRIKEAKGYSEGGMDAIVLHLVQKHNWLPRDIREMRTEDLRLVLHDEFNKYPSRRRTNPANNS